MAQSPARWCAKCRVPHPGGSRCPAAVESRREHDQRRGGSAERGYGYRWQLARAAYLLENPLCVECVADGRPMPATDVDHIVPHRGDMALFWNTANWQGLCDTHHKQKTGRGE